METRELSTRECTDLLRAGVAGRVAVAGPTGPQIMAVNYAVTDDAVVIRTSPFSVLGTYGRGAVVAFEIDGFDRARSRGWSVQARGRLDAITDAAELRRIREGAEPHPWAGRARSLYLRLPWTELTGRQVGGRWEPLSEVAARALR